MTRKKKTVALPETFYTLGYLFSSDALFSSSIFLREGGGRGTMLRFHFLSSFLDSLLPIPSSISLSLFTVIIRAICY
jgi:hypothetical protein